MSETVIFDWNASRAIQYKPKHLVVPSLPVKIALQGDSALIKAVEADPLLHQKLADLCKDECVRAAGVIDAQLTTMDKRLAGSPQSEIQKVQRQSDEVIALGFKAVTANINKKLDNLWEQLAKDGKDYRKYKLNSGVKVTLGVAGVAVGIGGLIAGPIAPLGIVTTWRGLVDLCKSIVSLTKEAETVGQSVYTDLKSLQTRYKNAPGTPANFGKVAGREALATALNTFVQLEMKNIPKVKSNCDLWKSKLLGLTTSSHDLAKKLNEALVECDKLDKRLTAPGSDPVSAKNAAAARAKVAGLRQKVQSLLIDVPKTHQRAENGRRAQQEAELGLQALATKAPKWTEHFDKALPIMVNLGLAAPGDVGGYMEAKNALEVVQASLGPVVDLASTANDTREAMA